MLMKNKLKMVYYHILPHRLKTDKLSGTHPIAAVRFGAHPIFTADVPNAQLDNEPDVDGVDDIINRFVALEENGKAPEYQSDMEDDEDDEDITEESHLTAFTEILSNAQKEAAARKKAKKVRKPNRPRFYSKNAPRTLRERAQKRQKFIEAGGKLITDFFEKSEERLEGTEAEVLEVSSDMEMEGEGTEQAVVEAPVDIPEPEPFNIHLADPQEGRKHLEKIFNEVKALESLEGPNTQADTALNALHYKDWPALRKATTELSLKVKDKNLDVVFCARLSAMLGALNLYLDGYTRYTWKQASFLAAHFQGKSVSYAQKIRTWIHRFLSHGELPMHRYGRFHASLLSDEDFRSDLKTFLMEKSKKGYIFAKDIVEYVNSEEVQKKLCTEDGKAVTITIRTAQRWFKKLDWRYGKKSRGMYIDGHEREDVVRYRNDFVQRWKEYEKRMVTFDKDGNPTMPNGFEVPQGPRFRLVLVTHDESTFYAHDRRKSVWWHPSMDAVPERKGEGVSVMVSAFLTPDWGLLKDDEDEARLFFEAGKGRDGYFDANDLLQETEKAIDIFENKTHGMMTGLFVFNNAPSHMKRAPDALSARKMPKGPKLGWTQHPNGPKMRDGFFNGASQPFYYPDNHPTMPGWFKGMEQIIRERGLYPVGGLRATCPTKCDDKADQQYWGAAKYRYRMTAKTDNMEDMKQNIKNCLDDVPWLHILCYANRSARYIHAYREGLDGAQAAWANCRYHGHRTLPPKMLKKAFEALP
ncbi:hypothetical protein K435DRAFT_810298 [Dendrothele bispora CBS 962.96]|uniref:Uncharacterized protein n=1 Tax=Dendrothele bispora (strain CBS 962.96) TaxID=1314807 RepID=A0A4S8KVR3_DENBC|nr:hypothetical protein K435DRAFT_810298 [Dendrothele bispora CBS 962.96]